MGGGCNSPLRLVFRTHCTKSPFVSLVRALIKRRTSLEWPAPLPKVKARRAPNRDQRRVLSFPYPLRINAIEQGEELGYVLGLGTGDEGTEAADQIPSIIFMLAWDLN